MTSVKLNFIFALVLAVTDHMNAQVQNWIPSGDLAVHIYHHLCAAADGCFSEYRRTSAAFVSPFSSRPSYLHIEPGLITLSWYVFFYLSKIIHSQTQRLLQRVLRQHCVNLPDDWESSPARKDAILKLIASELTSIRSQMKTSVRLFSLALSFV